MYFLVNTSVAHHIYTMWVRVETGLDHPGNSLSRSSGSDPLYKISESGPDSVLDHVSNELSMLASDDRSILYLNEMVKMD